MTAYADIVAQIAIWEGFQDKAYKCPAGVWTIGFGSTFWDRQTKVRKGDTIDRDQAYRLLHATVSEIWSEIQTIARIGSPDQIAAITSLAHNVGVHRVMHSTLMEYHRRAEYLAAGDQFLRWNKAGGRVLPGLIKRRRFERDLYLLGSPVLPQEADIGAAWGQILDATGDQGPDNTVLTDPAGGVATDE